MITMRLPMLPPTRLDRRRAGRRYRTLLISVLLHLAALLALVLLVRAPSDEGGAGAPSYQLLFEPPGAPEAGDTSPAPPSPAPATSEAPPTPAAPGTPAPAPPVPDALPGPPTPAPDAVPDPAVPPVPPAPDMPDLPQQPTAPATPAPPQPTPPAPAPETTPQATTVPDATPAPPAPPPPLPLAPTESIPQAEPAPFAPSIRLEQPPPQPPILPPVPDLVLQPPAPPAPLPPQPRPPAQTRLPRPPQQAPSATVGSFAHPLDLALGPATPRSAAPRIGAAPGSVASRSLDLATGPARAPNRQEAFFDARAAQIGADWKDGLESYWLRHRYYPRQAVEAGDDGEVQVELTVNRYGKVETVNVIGKSGSAFLDMSAVSVWRGAQLAPLPAEVAGDRITFAITIHYILIR